MQRTSWTSGLAVLVLLIGTAGRAEDEPARMTVRAGDSGRAMAPSMYGIFFEDINYAADGGLYAELVQNRSFEFAGKDAFFAWSKRAPDMEGCTIDVVSGQPVHPNNPHYLRVRAAAPGAGIVNEGFAGIPARTAGSPYRFSVFARAPGGYAGALEARLETRGGRVLGRCRVTGIGADWKKFTGAITVSAEDPDARLVLVTDRPGTLELDMVSLFPADTFNRRPNGMRADLVRMLADLKPSFMRFPGGCIVEGKDLANAYRWKDTVGPVETRRQNWNRWQDAVGIKAPQYYQSYGLGFFEFFQLCEDIGAEPLPILNCGMSCQYQDKELVPLEALQPWIDDAFDLIEFANGPADSRWGALRASMGHPEPFNMKYLGVGNEQWGPQYLERYDIFYKALKARYPDLQLITTSGPGSDGRDFDLAWNHFRKVGADIVDEHYYRPPQWFLDHDTRYDAYDRSGPKVFAGEYAAHNAKRRNDLFAALSEAAFMTGLERNADIVTMASYAPLLAKKDYTQWNVDLIWFDNTRVYGTPSYYVQQLFSANRPERVVPVELDQAAVADDARGGIALVTYHTRAEYRDVTVTGGDRVLFSYGANDTASSWQQESGTWSVQDGAFRQDDEKVVAVARGPEADWKDYSVALKARKLGGSEGFIIVCRGNRDGEGFQWNLGGWGNTKHAIQVLDEGARIVAETPGRIALDRWYDLRIELAGRRVQCFLDGQRIHELELPERPARRALYATAGREAGGLVLKVVNVASETRSVDIALDGFIPRGAAHAEVLTSASPADENSFDAPARVQPAGRRIPVAGPSFRYDAPAHSLTVLRVGGTVR